MTIIAGCRGQEFNGFAFFGPGTVGSGNALVEGEVDREVHQGQAAVAAHQDFIVSHPQYFGKQFARFGDTFQPTVVAQVDALAVEIVALQNAVQAI